MAIAMTEPGPARDRRRAGHAVRTAGLRTPSSNVSQDFHFQWKPTTRDPVINGGKNRPGQGAKGIS